MKPIAIVGLEVSYAGAKNKEEFRKTCLNQDLNSSNLSDSRFFNAVEKFQTDSYQNTADYVFNDLYAELEQKYPSEKDLLLSLSQSALKDAGYDQKDLSRCGIVSGCLSFPNESLERTLDDLYYSAVTDRQEPTVNVDMNDLDVPSAYVNRKLGLGGNVCYSIDAACASALYCLHLAQLHLSSGSVDMMLCGASCLPSPVFILTGFSVFRAMSKERSIPLNQGSQGLTPGEGGAMYVLKRYEDAVRDGDKIYGKLVGVSVNNAGKGLPLSPDTKSQIDCLERLYKIYNIPKESVQYVECHATGTALGDKSEVNAMRTVFNEKTPMFGSSKGNFGHTLVAAGFAGMLKVLQSMNSGIIPGTPGIQGKIDENVCDQNVPWPDTNGAPRRAGLSAFGFGGTNAHALFEEHIPNCSLSKSISNVPIPNVPMIVSGMACHFGTCRTLKDFEQMIFDGGHAACSLPTKRWRGFHDDKMHGCFIDNYHVDYSKIRTSMKPNDQLWPQQLLTVNLANDAIEDAQIQKGSNFAVLVGMGTDMQLYSHDMRIKIKSMIQDEGLRAKLMEYICDSNTALSYTSSIGNITATRIASKWGFTGPAFSITSGTTSVQRCLQVAQLLISSGEVDGAIVCGVDVRSKEEVYLTSMNQPLSTNDCPSFRLEQSSDEKLFVGEGAGVVVLQKPDADIKNQYAQINDVVDTNQVNLRDADYVELQDVVTKDMKTLVTEQGLQGKKTCALGSVESSVGNLMYASGIACLIKVCLSMYNRNIPCQKSWKSSKDPDTMKESIFYVPRYSRPWMKNADCRRSSYIVSPSLTVSMTDIAEHHEQSIKKSVSMWYVCANTYDELKQKLSTKTLNTENTGKYSVSIVGTPDSIDSEISEILKRFDKCVASQKPILTKRGSCFYPNPCSTGIAFVYGDTTASYPSVGNDLFRFCPKLHDFVEATTTNMWNTSDEAWNVRTTECEETLEKEEALRYDIVSMLRCGAYHSVCFTEIARMFKLVPDVAFGLSLGEISMLFAFSTKNSLESENVMKNLSSSVVWNKAFSNQCTAIRKAWNIDDDAELASFWTTYLVRTSYDDIKKHLDESMRIRVTIVNTDKDVLVCGVPSECETLFKKLGLMYFKAPQQGIIGHVPEAKSYKLELGKIIPDRMEIPQCDTKLYTSSSTSYTQNDTPSDGLINLYCNVANFPKHVLKAYHEDQCRVFIELGPSDFRSKSISAILKDKEHVSVAFDSQKHTSWESIVRASAQLHSNRVPMDCSPCLYQDTKYTMTRYERQIEMNGRFDPVIFSTEEKDILNNSILPQVMDKSKESDVIFDEADLLEFAEGDIAKVFGKEYSIIDTYSRRVRLPMRDYLLVTRVTKMDAKTNEYKPCTMTTEYDLPVNGSFSEGGDIPWAILVESGQCDLMLISYLGVDFQCKGERVYRLLDTTLTFFGVAQEGQTLKYDISINSFAKDENGHVKMFFFSYNCYVDGELLIEMRGGVAGFFTKKELDDGKGVVHTDKELKKRKDMVKKDGKNFIVKPCAKTTLSEHEMMILCDRKWKTVLGSEYADVNYKLTTPKILMIDRITKIDPSGGAYGLGLLVGEKVLDPNHWYFPCHFKGDQVMAGSLVSDGCSQLLKVFMIWMGFHKTVDQIVFRPIPGQPQKVRCRGQIGPQKGKLVYVMEIVDMGKTDEGYPYVKANVDIIDVNYDEGQTFSMDDIPKYGKGDLSRKIVVDFKNICLQMEGNPVDPSVATTSTLTTSRVPRDVSNATHLTWHPLAGNGNPTPTFIPTDLAAREIAFLPFPGNPNDNNFTPGEVPLNWYNIAEFQYGHLANCFGKEYDRFDHGSKASRMPGFELAMVTRILEEKNMDTPKIASMISEFDCPHDAWFYGRGTNVMPYSILMEIGLQTSGIISARSAALLNKDPDPLFRNLDAKSELVLDVDVRGKTIKNRTVSKSFSKMGDMMVHALIFELYVDDQLFYKGTTSFGWFAPEVFIKQIGLDNGKTMEPYHVQKGIPTTTLDMAGLYGSGTGGMVARDKRTILVDQVVMNENSGEKKLGYIHGYRDIVPNDWFFSCHFWMDPVMPGSLGVEAMFNIIEYYCLAKGYGSTMKHPIFVHDLGDTKWKYRGQLTRKNKRMDIEVHVHDVKVSKTRVSLVCSGNLYVDGLRVYRVDNIRYAVAEKEFAGASAGKCVDDDGDGVVNIVQEEQTDASFEDLNDLGKSLSFANGTVSPMTPHMLGDPSFTRDYGLQYPIMSGAMAKGIASADICIAMGKAGMMGSFGAGGLPISVTTKGIDKIQSELTNGETYMVNLIHSPFDEILEKNNVELFLSKGVKIIEASAFMSITKHIVHYRVAGLERTATGIKENTKVIAKVSRTELAEMFMRPPAQKFLDELVGEGVITREQADLSKNLPIADDIIVESDSGGHTDNRPLHVILPMVIHVRNRIMKELGYARKIRIGAAGGIGCPEAAKAAFSMGAAFVVTGTVNQMCRQSGSCDYVRKQLSEATYSDVIMAPAADMFDQGVELQVLKKGTFFPMRAKKLYEIYRTYNSLDEIPEKEMKKLEKTTFKKSLADVWKETRDFYENMIHDPEKVQMALKNPKLKMSMVFRWYLGKSSAWANLGIDGRQTDYQVWCGPAIGSFNDFIRGAYLDPKVSGVYPCVADVNRELIHGACFMERAQQYQRLTGNSVDYHLG